MDIAKLWLENREYFFEHLKELRHRFIRVIIFICIIFVFCFYLSENLLEILRVPIKDLPLVFLKPTEPFFAFMKLSFVAAIIFSLPFVIYHVWAFISPGLHAHEKRLLVFFLISFLFFFYLGVIFCYFIMLPYGIHFLLWYKTASLTPRLSLEYYMTLNILFLITFGVVFELPLILLFLTKIGIVKPSMLTRNRKYSILIIFIVSAILTPPDAFTQFLMAIPLCILYEVGVIFSKIVYKKRDALV